MANKGILIISINYYDERGYRGMCNGTDSLNNTFFESLCKISDEYYYMEDALGRSRWSPAAVDDFELPGEYVTNAGRLWRSFVHPDDLEMYDAEIKRMKDGLTDFHMLDYRVRKRNGEYIKIACRGNIVRNEEGKIQWFTGAITKINGGVDPVTQIANIYDAARDLEETFKNKAARGALMYLGIDNFKRINDLYTYSGGDEVLKKLAVKMRNVIPASAGLYRMEGDKFAIHFPYAEISDMQDIYNRVAEEAREIPLYNDVEVSVSLSAGVGFYPKDGSTPEMLQRNTQYAMERAKRQGKEQITFFSRELLEQYLKKLRMIEALKKSIKNDFKGFELYYQPIVDPYSRKVIECEALLRWKSEEFTNATPADFIPVLEETGLIREVGEWIVREAISKMKEWDEDLVVNINVSYKQLKDEGFAQYVLDIIHEYQFNPTKVVVELTESCKAHDISNLMSALDKLRAHDVMVALDDFGTGYASLDVLREVSADWVKIDHKFVAQCKDNWVDRNIVRHIILLAHALDIKVCVEGIENEENYQVASEENADTLQGYYFSRPVPAKEFNRMLKQNRQMG